MSDAKIIERRYRMLRRIVAVFGCSLDEGWRIGQTCDESISVKVIEDDECPAAERFLVWIGDSENLVLVVSGRSEAEAVRRLERKTDRLLKRALRMIEHELATTKGKDEA